MKGKKTGGRVKGTPNRLSGALKDMILNALAGVGGEEYLRLQAGENPTAFLTLVGKVLPMTVDAHLSGSVDLTKKAVDEIHPGPSRGAHA